MFDLHVLQSSILKNTNQSFRFLHIYIKNHFKNFLFIINEILDIFTYSLALSRSNQIGMNKKTDLFDIFKVI